jgi:hypothetical protein
MEGLMSNMYGKQRVVLTQNGFVVLAGSNSQGGSYHIVGKYFDLRNERDEFQGFRVIHLQRKHMWKSYLTAETTDTFISQTKAEVRKRIASTYY